MAKRTPDMRNRRTAKPASPPRQQQQQKEKYRKHQRWLLLLCHATDCTSASEGGHCKFPQCSKAKKLWAHIVKCHSYECGYGLCIASRILVCHHQHCQDEQCPLCLPVRRVILQQQLALLLSRSSYTSSVGPSTCEASSQVRSSHGNSDESPPHKNRRKTETETLVSLSKNENKIEGGSLAELFTLEQLEEHICSLRKWGEEICKKQVSGVEAIFVRVVSSIEKEIQVKQHFLDIFRKKDFPKTFPYRSKVVLLFQNIEGVDVLIFAFYVQEFGPKCPFPNESYVYLSYLDSVEYFRPKEPAASETSLRRFVYHEIMIGYLEYCKLKGFATCYIWVSAPFKGDDYIFYCHPPTQNMLNNSLLLKWYKDMVDKAINEKIVMKLTNIYNQFWGKSNTTAARLPYCEGNFFPDKMEELIMKMEEENWNCRRGKCLTVSRKDNLLMKKLEMAIEGTKRHHMLIHLHPRCSHCFHALVNSKYWVCKICLRDFQICNKCYEKDMRCELSQRHGAGMHKFDPVEVKNVAADTDDEEEIRSPFFDNRDDFQNLCKGNYYQFDTLRHAKYSSMMILFHICNPNKHSFIALCNICNKRIEVGEVGWRCETCRDYDECAVCHQNENLPKHPHPLISQPP